MACSRVNFTFTFTYIIRLKICAVHAEKPRHEYRHTRNTRALPVLFLHFVRGLSIVPVEYPENTPIFRLTVPVSYLPPVSLQPTLPLGFTDQRCCQTVRYLCAGAHVNPAVSVAMAVTRNITPLRALMFVTAQCGGGIAGAALLYG